MSVWNFEAAEIADATDLETRPIYQTPDLRDFLAFDRSPKRIIAGLKGTGKTLFLKLISHHFRQLPGVTLIPRLELTERLYSIDFDFSGSQAVAWSDPERWQQVWRTVLAVVVLKAVEDPLPDDILEVFPKNLGLSIAGHLSVALQNRTTNNKQFQAFFSEHLDASLQSITRPVCLFLDNIDEALARHVGRIVEPPGVAPTPQSGARAYDLWLNAQVGFIHATRELCARNAHLKLFGTVRAEALRDSADPTQFNALANILDLSYTPADLRGIFETKLRQLRERQPNVFVRPEVKDHVDAFFPASTIVHPSVRHANGAPYEENVFDYIRRHTRGRPRELDFIGHRLQVLPPSERTSEAIIKLMRDISADLYAFARGEAVPSWDPHQEELLARIPSNVVPRSFAERTAKKYFGEEGRLLWRQLFMNGLCGAVVKVHPSQRRQFFAYHDRQGHLTEEKFWAADTWVIHPCASIATRHLKTRYKAHARSPVGHDYPFAQPLPHVKHHIHMLIGAGKLGFGLVVPTVFRVPGTRVVVIARQSEEWHPLLTNGAARPLLRVFCEPREGVRGRTETVPFQVVSDAASNWDATLRATLRRHSCVVLVVAHDKSIGAALQLADSVGLSVGSSNLETVAHLVAGATPKKARVVLTYENDEKKVSAATAILKRAHITLVPTVVDRICSERRVTEDGIDVCAENYARITLLLDTFVAQQVPWVVDREIEKTVAIVRDVAAFDLERERKKRLVNALQTSAAVLARQMLIREGVPEAVADEQLLGLLVDNMELRGQLLGLKDVMVLAVLGTLPLTRLDTDPDIPALHRELHEQADRAIGRMKSSPDAPARVLRDDSITLAEKYERLFQDVEQLVANALRSNRVAGFTTGTGSELAKRLGVVKDAFLFLHGRAARRDGLRPRPKSRRTDRASQDRRR